MSKERLIEKMADLFRETGKTHHQAFIETDGEDPDWALWYAEYLEERLTPFLAAPITRSRLVFCLLATDEEHRAVAADTPWPEFYARRFLECLCAAQDANSDRLALYHFDGCPFCAHVRRVIDEFGIDVELRDIYADRTYLDQLIAARGRATVPILNIRSADGDERWMPESTDIIRYLRATYGATKTAA